MTKTFTTKTLLAAACAGAIAASSTIAPALAEPAAPTTATTAATQKETGASESNAAEATSDKAKEQTAPSTHKGSSDSKEPAGTASGSKANSLAKDEDSNVLAAVLNSSTGILGTEGFLGSGNNVLPIKSAFGQIALVAGVVGLFAFVAGMLPRVFPELQPLSAAAPLPNQGDLFAGISSALGQTGTNLGIIAENLPRVLAEQAPQR